MKKLLICTLLLVSCANADEVPPLITNVDNTCSLSINGAIVPTALKGKCAWAIDSEGKLYTRTVDNEKVAILIGKRITDNEVKEWSLQSFTHCSLQSIGVKINETGEAVAFSHPIKDLIICSELHLDKKIFFSYKWD